MMKDTSRYAPVVLRLTLVAVYVWFGASQLLHPNNWTSLVPDYATGILDLTALTIVKLNGIFELLAATCLAIGFKTRIIAALLFLHLFVITTHLGLTAIGVRDFGLSFATLAVALYGADMYCLDRHLQQPGENLTAR